MKRFILCLVLLVGCGTPGYIRADAIEGPLRREVSRHDLYMDHDAALSDLERRANKRDGELLLKALEEAQKPTE